MKRFLITTAFVLGTAGMAAAQDMDSNQMRELVAQDLETYNYDVDVSQLSEAELSQLYFIATSTDSSSVRQDRYDRILKDGNAERANSIRTYRPMPGDEDTEEVQVTMPRNQLRSLVQQMLETYDMNVDVSSLDDETLSALYLVDTSTDSSSEERTKIQDILNQ